MQIPDFCDDFVQCLALSEHALDPAPFGEARARAKTSTFIDLDVIGYDTKPCLPRLLILFRFVGFLNENSSIYSISKLLVLESTSDRMHSEGLG